MHCNARVIRYASETPHISSFVPCWHCTGRPFVAVSNVVRLSFCECQDFRKYYYMFPKCDSLNAILCCFSGTHTRRIKTPLRKRWSPLKRTLMAYLDSSRPLICRIRWLFKCFFRIFALVLDKTSYLIYINITFHVGGLRLKGPELQQVRPFK